MKILNTARTFRTFNSKEKLLFIEAFIYLCWARVLIRLPLSKFSSSLGERMKETSTEQVLNQYADIKNVSNVIAIVSRNTFWESKCLVRAIAGMKMLERRNIESTLYLGTAKDEYDKLIAHAWLRSGPLYITGAEVMKDFTIVEKFAKKCSD